MFRAAVISFSGVKAAGPERYVGFCHQVFQNGGLRWGGGVGGVRILALTDSSCRDLSSLALKWSFCIRLNCLFTSSSARAWLPACKSKLLMLVRPCSRGIICSLSGSAEKHSNILALRFYVITKASKSCAVQSWNNHKILMTSSRDASSLQSVAGVTNMFCYPLAGRQQLENN